MRERPWTVDEVAEYLRIDQLTVYKLVREGKLPAFRVGRSLRFLREVLEEWLHQQTTKPFARILVVDDERNICDLFRDVLLPQGYEVMAVGDGASALEWFRRAPFDLVFLDLKMPEMNGVEVFEHLRRLDPSLAVVIVTGYPDSDLMAQAMEKGPFAIMKKPFGPVDILNVLDTFVLRSPWRRARRSTQEGE